jgi:transposase-like protein
MKPCGPGERKLALLLTDALRQKRRGAVGSSWYVDETYINMQGQWRYLYCGAKVDTTPEYRQVMRARCQVWGEITGTGVAA